MSLVLYVASRKAREQGNKASLVLHLRIKAKNLTDAVAMNVQSGANTVADLLLDIAMSVRGVHVQIRSGVVMPRSGRCLMNDAGPWTLIGRFDESFHWK